MIGDVEIFIHVVSGNCETMLGDVEIFIHAL